MSETCFSCQRDTTPNYRLLPTGGTQRRCPHCLACGPKGANTREAGEGWNAIPRRGAELPAWRPPWTILREVAADLLECRRYVRTPHAASPEFLRDALDSLTFAPLDSDTISRLYDGIDNAAKFVTVDPQWLESALYAAAAELSVEASRLEPKEDPA